MDKDIRYLVENYKFNLERLDMLHNKLKQLKEYNTKITAAYGHNTQGSKGAVSSKVERHVLRIKETEEEILDVEWAINTVDTAEKVLNNKEKEVIDLIKKGYYNKLTKMAKILGQNKDYVQTKRDSAFKKMNSYIANM